MNFANEADFDKDYIRDDRLERPKPILEKNTLEVVSSKWIGIKAKYKFHCMTCGHEWDAQGTTFFNSRRASGCDRCARSKAGESRLLGAGSLDSFVKGFGGERWVCSLGDFNNMTFPNKFCFECDKAKN